MGEKNSIQKTPKSPATIDSLVQGFKTLGVTPGMTLLVHSSLSAMGWVCGGAQAVILALEQVLGDDGTLVMPTHSGDWSDPEDWSNPPVPEDWWQLIRESMPAFDCDLTPTRKMGQIPETFRKQKGVVRSYHPQVSFAAWGKYRDVITRDHALNFGLGEQSPLARIYDLDGYVLLLGVTHAVNTSLHLAEYRTEFVGKCDILSGAPIMRKGRRAWMLIEDVNIDSFDDFDSLGQDFVRDCEDVQIGKISQADTQLFSQRAAVDYAVDWIEANRDDIDEEDV